MSEVPSEPDEGFLSFWKSNKTTCFGLLRQRTERFKFQEETLDDLRQELSLAVMRLYRRDPPHELTEESNRNRLFAWINVTAHNIGIHQLKKQIKFRAKPLHESLLNLGTTDNKIAAVDAADLFHRCATRMDSIDAELIRMRLIESMTYEQISRELWPGQNIAPGTVGSRCDRAISRFQFIVQQVGENQQ